MFTAPSFIREYCLSSKVASVLQQLRYSTLSPPSLTSCFITNIYHFIHHSLPALWAVVVAVTQPRGWGMPIHKQHGASGESACKLLQWANLVVPSK